MGEGGFGERRKKEERKKRKKKGAGWDGGSGAILTSHLAPTPSLPRQSRLRQSRL